MRLRDKVAVVTGSTRGIGITQAKIAGANSKSVEQKDRYSPSIFFQYISSPR